MTQRQIFLFWPLALLRSIRRFWIRRQLEQISYHLKHIAAQRENDRHVERVLMGRQALLQSDLRQI